MPCERGEGTCAEFREGIEWERRAIQSTVLGPLPSQEFAFCAFTRALANTE